MRIEVDRNFLTVDIYKGEQLVSAIDLEGSVIELVKELTIWNYCERKEWMIWERHGVINVQIH